MIDLSSLLSLWCRGRRHDKNLEPGKPIFNARQTNDRNLRNTGMYTQISSIAIILQKKFLQNIKPF